jgi:hypothetical protein
MAGPDVEQPIDEETPMQLTLVRSRADSNDQETFGLLSAGDLVLQTVEQPWKDNLIGHSCVPAGSYTISPHVSPTKGNVYILDGPAQNVYAEDPPPPGGRSLILIHIANSAIELEGCIAPGLSKGVLFLRGAERNCVLDSKAALQQLFDLLAGETHTLSVDWDS